MAADLLANSGEPIIHSTRHDLESFYWTLLWVVLRHTDNKWGHKGQTGQLTCADTFKQDDATNAQSGKSGWLRHRAKFLDISRNSPLTTLMKDFSLLVYYDRLDYDSVLALFDTALAADSWPTANDGPLEYIPPDLRTVNDFLSSEEDLSHQRRRHARKRARAQAGKGKARETTPEQSDDDPEEDYDMTLGSQATMTRCPQPWIQRTQNATGAALTVNPLATSRTLTLLLPLDLNRSTTRIGKTQPT